MIDRYAFTGLVFGLALFSTNVQGQTQATAPMPGIGHDAAGAAHRSSATNSIVFRMARHAEKEVGMWHRPAVEFRGSAPANDNCSAAILLAVNASCVPTTGDVAGATQSIPSILCNTYTGDADDDVWYKFVANAAAQTVSVTGSIDFDAVVDLRSGACSGINIACADATVEGQTETINATGLSVGATYYVRVYDFYAGAAPSTTFDICIYGTPPAPANDDCGDMSPVALAAGATINFTGDNTGATSVNEGPFAGFPTVWHAFTTTVCTDVTVSYCGTSPAFGNVWVSLSTDCPSTTFLDASSFNDTDCPDGNITAIYTALPAGTYWLPVLQDVGATGPYTIDVNAVACAGGGAPPNDLCADVTPQLLTAGGSLTFTGTSLGALNTEGYPWASVWEAFTITQCMDVTWDFCGSLDNMLVITGALNGCPATALANSCNSPEITCPDGIQLSYSTNLQDLAPGTYYILIPYVAGTWGGAYTINMTGAACSTPVPGNNECAGSVVLTPGLTCVNTIGTTAGATQSLPNLACGGFTGQADDDVWYSFTAVAPGGSIIVTPQDSLDPVIQLYSGTCAGLSALDCADAGVGGDTEELVYGGLNIGTTYYFRVHSYDLGTYCNGFFNVCVTYDPSTGINTPSEAGWNVFPNPTNGDLTVIYNGATDNMRIELFDLTGRTVYVERTRLVSGSTLALHLGGQLAQGTYTMRLTGAQGHTEQRVVVQ